jgi:hypothetical protein
MRWAMSGSEGDTVAHGVELGARQSFLRETLHCGRRVVALQVKRHLCGPSVLHVHSVPYSHLASSPIAQQTWISKRLHQRDSFRMYRFPTIYTANALMQCKQS